jgi:hypothetical protein
MATRAWPCGGHSCTQPRSRRKSSRHRRPTRTLRSLVCYRRCSAARRPRLSVPGHAVTPATLNPAARVHTAPSSPTHSSCTAVPLLHSSGSATVAALPRPACSPARSGSRAPINGGLHCPSLPHSLPTLAPEPRSAHITPRRHFRAHHPQSPSPSCSSLTELADGLHAEVRKPPVFSRLPLSLSAHQRGSLE